MLKNDALSPSLCLCVWAGTCMHMKLHIIYKLSSLTGGVVPFSAHLLLSAEFFDVW
jgi:hypothetical protein